MVAPTPLKALFEIRRRPAKIPVANSSPDAETDMNLQSRGSVNVTFSSLNRLASRIGTHL